MSGGGGGAPMSGGGGGAPLVAPGGSRWRWGDERRRRLQRRWLPPLHGSRRMNLRERSSVPPVPPPPVVGHARAGIDVDRLVGGGQVLVQWRVLAELHGGRAQVDRHVHPPLRGGRFETGWQSHSLSERSRRRVGDLGAWLARRRQRRQ